MDAREGRLDPLSGQRAALPVESGDESSAAQYLLAVRAEAAELAVARALSRKRAHADDAEPRDAEIGEPPLRPRPRPREDGIGVGLGVGALDYGDSSGGGGSSTQLSTADVVRATARLFDGAAQLDAAAAARSGLAAVYSAAKPRVAGLAPVHPAACTSLATWKEYVVAHEPVPLNHVDTFRLFKYLAKWLASRADEGPVLWAWSLLLRTPSVLSGDEVAVLRDVARALAASPSSVARAFVFVVGTEYGQRDLLLLPPPPPPPV